MRLFNTKKRLSGMFEHVMMLDEMDATLTREDLMNMKRQISSWGFVAAAPILLPAGIVLPRMKEEE